jgi:phosphohistidine phosphatase
MLLYVVRHAIACVRDPVAWPDDRERPLTPAGVKRFRQAARGLRALEATADRVLSSRYVRAWQTAEILAGVARWPEPEPCPALESDSGPSEVVAALRPYANTPALAVVGHEPQLHELASLLLTADGGRAALEFRKGAVACLLLDGPATAGTATLLWHAPPKLLRAAAG